MAYKVQLSAAGNPDFGPMNGYSADNYLACVSLDTSVEVATLAEASAACRRFIRDHDLGGGNWTGGKVTDDDGNHVANVSYNGRVWEPGKWPTAEISID